MASLLPHLPQKTSTIGDESFVNMSLAGIPVFKYEDLTHKVEIGRGAFGSVFSAKLVEEIVVIKEMYHLEEQGKKLFLKEAKLLHSLGHENIVAFRGVSMLPPAMMLEFMCFDFKPFGQPDLKVYSTKALLAEINEVPQFFSLIPKIAKDTTRGLQYLHSTSVAHRDLKPANILVSNQHCSHLVDPAEVEQMWIRKPVMCKLTDFGESRSDLIHTQTFLSTRTHFVNRGTPAFMAPEILTGKSQSMAMKKS